ncbi:hypothetical protein QQZ08_006765 [Neonectria magnoliae]|uniref:Aminoglycoside phosphotransferase domain-containing protein n=1 Tax=Neonectria magnoliae TaxID=2732573 RepID=A0ABR1HZR5_9HYPO
MPPQINTPKTSEPEAGPLESSIQGFPAATDDQYNQARKTFIESLDSDAVCALASRFSNGKPYQVVNKDNGSFNVCFFVEFEDGPKKLEFPLIGSVMPDPNGSPHPVVGLVISMSAATRRLPPPPTFASAENYMRHQFSLVSAFFLPPVRDHTIDDIKQEVFAPHGMERIFQLYGGPFVLNRLDLQSPNIIVDKSLQIQGIIDWEFASTIPLQFFTPPSWIIGHDSVETNKHIHAEFRDVLDEKSKISSVYDQLRREWYGQSDAKGKMGLVIKALLAFCKFFSSSLSCVGHASSFTSVRRALVSV